MVEESSTLLLIEQGSTAWTMAAEAAGVAPPEARVEVGAEGFRWLCPLDRLASLRDFLGFEDHVVRGAQRRGTPVPPYWYEAPVYYKGNHRQVIGPDDVCPWPAYAGRLDFELEMAMVVGRAGRDVSRQRAGDHIFGFTIFNDFSARDVQAKEVSAWLGPAKGKDFCNALGPCIVTADDVGAEPDLEMVCRVNGEEWGRARSSQTHWRWSDMIAYGPGRRRRARDRGHRRAAERYGGPFGCRRLSCLGWGCRGLRCGGRDPDGRRRERRRGCEVHRIPAEGHRVRHPLNPLRTRVEQRGVEELPSPHIQEGHEPG